MRYRDQARVIAVLALLSVTDPGPATADCLDYPFLFSRWADGTFGRWF